MPLDKGTRRYHLADVKSADRADALLLKFAA
jgi:hypothetical protein